MTCLQQAIFTIGTLFIFTVHLHLGGPYLLSLISFCSFYLAFAFEAGGIMLKTATLTR